MAYFSSCNEEFALSATAMWAAPSALRSLVRRLQTRDTSKCQRLLTVFFERSVAYLSEVRALFSFRPSARCIAPAAPMLL